jgi:hypothetical protein
MVCLTAEGTQGERNKLLQLVLALQELQRNGATQLHRQLATIQLFGNWIQDAEEALGIDFADNHEAILAG